jgi:hypothetical protein
MKNLAIMNMKQKNAALLDEKFDSSKQDHASLKRDVQTGRAEFPRYGDTYESLPGTGDDKKK